MCLLRQPLFRLLAVNLAFGMVAAVLMLAGLLALNPHGLRDLILSDRSPAVALGLLLFGFIITFGSVVMGTAIMAIGNEGSSGGNTNFARTGALEGGAARNARVLRRPKKPPGLFRNDVLVGQPLRSA